MWSQYKRESGIIITMRILSKFTLIGSALLNISAGVMFTTSIVGMMMMAADGMPRSLRLMLMVILVAFVWNAVSLLLMLKWRWFFFYTYSLGALCIISIGFYLMPPWLPHTWAEFSYGDPFAYLIYYILVPSQIIPWIAVVLSKPSVEVLSGPSELVA